MATVTTPEDAVESSPDVLSDPAPYEVAAGRRVEIPPMGTYPVEVASILHEHLAPFVRRAGLGRAIVEPLFRIDHETQYRPDVAFVSDAKWPVGRRSPTRQPWAIVPDLAIEVISETDRAVDVLRKVRHYFGAGVRAVWLVYPSLEVIHIFDSFTQIEVLTRADSIDGGDLIPGFRLPLADLFAGDAEEEAEAEAAGPVA